MKYDQGCNPLIHRIERSEINIKGIENVFYEIVTENFINLETDIQTQEMLKIPNRYRKLFKAQVKL